MDMCNSCKVRQAWLFEAGDGCCGQIVCDCLEQGVDGYALDTFEKALIAKWIGGYNGDDPTPSHNDDIAQTYTKSEEVKKTPRCNQCKWKQAWLLEHRSKGHIICTCLNGEVEDSYEFNSIQKAIVEKWLPTTINSIDITPSK